MHDESFQNPADDHLQEHRDILARLVALETKVEKFTFTNKPSAPVDNSSYYAAMRANDAEGY